MGVLETRILEDDEAINLWRDRAGSSFDDCLQIFKRFKREVLDIHPVFGGMPPGQLVEWQLNAKGRQIYVLKGLAQRWIQAHPNWRVGTKQTYLSQLSSFWLHNHAPWPPDPSFHFSSDVPPVDGSLTKDAFIHILMNSDKMYRVVFLMMGQALLGEGELVYVNVKHWQLVLEALTRNVGVFKIPLPGRKTYRNRKMFFTMLSTKSDWAYAMRDYLKSLPHVPKGMLFRNSHGKPLTKKNIQYYFLCRAKETGEVKEFTPNCRCGGETVKVRDHKTSRGRTQYHCKECGRVNLPSSYNDGFSHVRYGKNPHEIRDLMRSRWRASGAKTVVAEFIMQHGEQVDPNEYDKMKYTPGYAENEYRRALSWLNILSMDPEKVSRFDVANQLEASEAKVEVLTRELKQVKALVETLEDQIEKRFDEIEKKTKQWTKTLE